jgi:hypothetical protein
MSSDQQINTWMQMHPKPIQAAMTIKKAEEVGPLYRIDTDTPKVFFPRMPLSAGTTENFSVPRICVAPSLVGCMFGYTIDRVLYDFFDGDVDEPRFAKYLGGFSIVRFDYSHCVIPNKKLVYDSKQTDEHWLVGFSPETSQYKPIKVGKVLLDQVHYSAERPKNKKKPMVNLEFYLEVSDKEGLQIDRLQRVESGFYHLTLKPKDDGGSDLKHPDMLSIKAISSSEYKEKKMKVAAMLSFQEPVSASWK